MAYNNISAELTSSQEADIVTKLQEIRDILNFTVNLTTEERRFLRKMGNKRTSYVLAVHDVVAGNPDILPASFNAAEFSRDVTLLDSLKAVEVHINKLAEGINDTIMALGNEAVKQADTCYKYVKVAAESNQNLKKAASKIGSHFSSSRSLNDEDPVDNSVDGPLDTT